MMSAAAAAVVVFRCRPAHLAHDPAAVDALNARILERVNASGEVFLSHTRVRDRYALRLALGNLRRSRDTIAAAWRLVQSAAS